MAGPKSTTSDSSSTATNGGSPKMNGVTPSTTKKGKEINGTTTTANTVSSSSSPPSTPSSKTNGVPKKEHLTKEDFRSFQITARRICELAPSYISTATKLSDLGDRISSLELRLSDKNVELDAAKKDVEDMKKHQKLSMKEHEERRDEWKEGSKKVEEGLKEEIEKLKSDAKSELERKLKEQRQNYEGRVAELEKELAEEKAKNGTLTTQVTTLSAQVGQAKKKAQDNREDADAYKKKLDAYKDDLKVLEEVNLEALKENLKTAIDKYLGVISQHFGADLPDGVLADPERWEALQPAFSHLPAKLYPKNTDAAKNARMIAALHTFSPLLEANIFTPICMLNSYNATPALYEIFDHELSVDPEKENLIRAYLLNAYKDEMDDRRTLAIDETLAAALERLRGLLAEDEVFEREMEDVLVELSGVWMGATRSKKLILASTVEDGEDEGSKWPWWHIENFDHNTDEDDLPEDYLLNLFPRIFVHEDVEGKILHHGYVLRSDRDAVADSKAGFKEWQDELAAAAEAAEEAAKAAEAAAKAEREALRKAGKTMKRSGGGIPARRTSISTASPTSPNGDRGSFLGLGIPMQQRSEVGGDGGHGDG